MVELEGKSKNQPSDRSQVLIRHDHTNFNDLARQEPHVVTRQWKDVLQQVKGQSLAASQPIELAPAV